MRDLERLSNVPGVWLMLGIVIALIAGTALVEWLIKRQYDRWTVDLEARYAFQPSHLEESEAAAITHLHQQHQQQHDHQQVA